LDKASFDSEISSFFSKYLIDRRTQYVWKKNKGESKALSSLLFSLLSTLLPSIIYLEKELKNILYNIPISILSFVDNSLFISQEKSFEKSNANLFCSYSIIFSLVE